VGIGLGCAVVGWAAVSGLYRLVGAAFPFLFLFVVFLAALAGDRLGGLSALPPSVTGVYYYTDPIGWRITASGAFSVVLFLVASLAIVEVITRMHAAIAAMDALLSSVSHDLKTPLTSLGLQEQRLLKSVGRKSESPPPEDLQRHSQTILEAVRKLSFMIDNLLDVGRIHSRRLRLAPVDADFAKIVRDVIGRLRPVLEERGYSIQTTGLDEPCPGRWDVLAVERVVANLLSNAIKYGDGKPIEVSVETDPTEVCFAVADHGIGIAADARSRLFKPFEKAPMREGTAGHGLGLWIVQRLVEEQKGRVVLESRIGEGTRVTVVVPRGNAAATATDLQGAKPK
jgi:signal transduction histidine kinase